MASHMRHEPRQGAFDEQRATTSGNGDGGSFSVFDEIEISSGRWLGPHGFNRWKKRKHGGGFDVL